MSEGSRRGESWSAALRAAAEALLVLAALLLTVSVAVGAAEALRAQQIALASQQRGADLPAVVCATQRWPVVEVLGQRYVLPRILLEQRLERELMR